MFKPLKEVFAPATPEQTYLDERLRSARWLGWEGPAASAPALSLLAVARPAGRARTAPAGEPPAAPVPHGKPA